MMRVTLSWCAFAVLLTGCRPQQLGSIVSPTRADAVDATWVQAVRNCWPEMKDTSTTSIAASLLDPHAFRGAFAGFATMNDKTIEAIAAHPVVAAPPPDTGVFRNPSGPTLTRAQATQPNFVADSHANTTSTADTLCVVHTGSPVGFK